MLTKVHGIVLRAIKYSETSIIFDLLTAEHGVQSFIVGGVRKKNSKWSSSLFQLMSLVEVVAYIKQNDSLNRVKEARLTHHYAQIPYDPIRRSIGVFMIEVVQKSVRSDEESASLFEFVRDSFLSLDQAAHSPSDHHLLFMLELSRYLGFFPDGLWREEQPHFHLSKGIFVSTLEGNLTLDLDRSRGLSSCLQHIADHDQQVVLSRKQRRLLLEDILSFYTYHLDHFRQVNAHKVFADLLE